MRQFDVSVFFNEGCFYPSNYAYINPLIWCVSEYDSFFNKMISLEGLEGYIKINDCGKIGLKCIKETSKFILKYIDGLQIMHSNHTESLLTLNNSINNGSKTYIMYDAISKLYKIGKSKNPKVREKTLSAQMPKIVLFAVNDVDIEKQLHKEYHEKRIRGEWFKLNNNDLKNIINKGFSIT